MNIPSLRCPKFALIIMIALGCIDLFRAFIHTVVLDYAATNVFIIGV